VLLTVVGDVAVKKEDHAAYLKKPVIEELEGRFVNSAPHESCGFEIPSSRLQKAVQIDDVCLLLLEFPFPDQPVKDAF
jgi:hypothetical protein